MIVMLDFFWIAMFVMCIATITLFFGWVTLRKPSQYYIAALYGSATTFVFLLMLCVVTMP